MLTVSVVIPAYNAALFLQESLRSVFKQDREAQEVIVVDDCSTDNTARIAKTFPITLLRTDRNAGHSTARNLAISVASGDVIAWLDADDYWLPHHLSTTVGLLEQHPEAAVSFSGVEIFGRQQLIWRDFPCSDKPRSVFWECEERTIVPAMSAVTRTDAIRGVGGFNSAVRIAPDYDLWLRMSLIAPFISTESITARYRFHDSQITAKAPLRQMQSLYYSRWRMYQHLLKTGASETATELAKRIADRWNDDVTRAWHARDMKRLRALLACVRVVPDGWRMWIRMRGPASMPVGVLKTWDRYTSLRRDHSS